MGDCGSLLLGFSLAALTLGSEGVRGSRSDVLSVIAGPVFVLLIPIFDTTLVTVARLLSGRSPAMGGRDHSSHRLVAIGLSERNAGAGVVAAGGGRRRHRPAAPQCDATGCRCSSAALFLLAMALFAVYLLARARLRRDHAADARQRRDAAAANSCTSGASSRSWSMLRCVVRAYYCANRWLFDPEAYLRNAEIFYRSLPIVVAVQLVAFFIVGVYRGHWQYRGRWKECLRHRPWRHCSGSSRALIFTDRDLRVSARAACRVRCSTPPPLLASITVARTVLLRSSVLGGTLRRSGGVTPARPAPNAATTATATNTNINGCTVMV